MTQASALAAKPTAQPDDEVVKRFNVRGSGGWDGLSADAGRHRLFISRSDRVMVVDSDNGKLLGTIAATQGVPAIARVPALGHGFTGHGCANANAELDRVP